jgi:hypothetical protein
LNGFSPGGTAVADAIYNETAAINEEVPEDEDEMESDKAGPSFGRKRRRT